MSFPLSRRKFVAASASAFSFTYLPSRVFGANERLNIGCIGVGGKGAGEVRDLAAAGCNIVALCDVDDVRAAGSYAKFPNARRYRDFRKMLEKESGLDAVSVSTPDHTHAVASVMAMKLGKHVYCQKPLTHSIYEARVMQETANEMGVATQMGNQAHASDGLRRAVEWVRAGLVGTVREVHTWTNRPIWPQGMANALPAQPVPSSLDWELWLGPAPRRPYNDGYVPFNWRGWWDFGTGALGDMGCHIIDMPFWALELNSPTSVKAESGYGTSQSPPMWSTVTYEFPASDKRPAVRLVWYDGYRGEDRRAAPRNLPPESVLQGVDASQCNCVVVGDKGRFYFNRSRPNWTVKPQSLMDEFEKPDPHLPRVPNEDVEWVQACKGESVALSNFSYSGPLTECILLGNVAIRVGGKLQWDAKQMRCPNAPEAEEYVRRQYRRGWSL